MLRKGRDGFGRSAQVPIRGRGTVGDGTSFDRWLDRELRLIHVALSEPAAPDLVDLIKSHKKITR